MIVGKLILVPAGYAAASFGGGVFVEWALARLVALVVGLALRWTVG